MRKTTLARAGAILTASALAVSLGAGPVSAAESTSTSGKAVAASAPSAGTVQAAGVPTSGIRFSSGVITRAETNRFYGNGSFAPEDATSATVIVNGVARGTVSILYSGPVGDNLIAVDIPRVWGSGRVQLDVAGIRSNVFYARKLVTTLRKDGYALNIKRRNNSVKFSARQIKIVNASTGGYDKVRSVKLQQLKGSKWKTIKNIKLNSKGNGSYSTSIKKKYRYRLYIPRTSTKAKFYTIKTRKI